MSIGTEVSWCKSLKKNDMLEMAFHLSKHALPAWNNYHSNAEIKYELDSLPEQALQDIERMIKGKRDEKTLNKHFTTFITPVIHIQDGHLKFPYEVKLAFLSVFHILHGMLSTSNRTAAREAFSSAIIKAVDAIKIAGILTAAEIAVLVEKYYFLSQNIID